MAPENLTNTYGKHFGTFWKASDDARYYHTPDLGHRTGVGADGKEYMVVEFKDDVAYEDGHVLLFKPNEDSDFYVTNDRSAVAGIVPAGVLEVPPGVNPPGKDDRGFIQIKGIHDNVLKDPDAAIQNAPAVLGVHASQDGALTEDALGAVSYETVGFTKRNVPANGTRCRLQLALFWT